MATSTERRRDEVEEAYEIQARAGIRVGLVCIISEGCVAEVELSESCLRFGMLLHIGRHSSLRDGRRRDLDCALPMAVVQVRFGLRLTPRSRLTAIQAANPAVQGYDHLRE